MEHDLGQAGKTAGKMLAKPFRMAFVLVGLAVIATTLLLAPSTQAADENDGYRLIRVIETGQLGHPNPLGLAYSPRADSLSVRNRIASRFSRSRVARLFANSPSIRSSCRSSRSRSALVRSRTSGDMPIRADTAVAGDTPAVPL